MMPRFKPTREVKDEAEKRGIIRHNLRQIKTALTYMEAALKDNNYTTTSIEAGRIAGHADRISRACYGRTYTTQKKDEEVIIASAGDHELVYFPGINAFDMRPKKDEKSP